jgi:hypothetical protein
MVVMLWAGKPGCNVFARRMFAGNRVGRMHGAGTSGAVICQSGAVTRLCGAARTGCRGVTPEAATPAVAAATGMSAAARTAAASTAASAAAASARVAATRPARAGRRT